MPKYKNIFISSPMMSITDSAADVTIYRHSNIYGWNLWNEDFITTHVRIPPNVVLGSYIVPTFYVSQTDALAVHTQTYKSGWGIYVKDVLTTKYAATTHDWDNVIDAQLRTFPAAMWPNGWLYDIDVKKSVENPTMLSFYFGGSLETTRFFKLCLTGVNLRFDVSR